MIFPEATFTIGGDMKVSRKSLRSLPFRHSLIGGQLETSQLSEILRR